MVRPIGLLVLLAAGAGAMTLSIARAAAPPGCAPGGAPVTFEGHVTQADAGPDAPRYLLQAFDVAAGTTRIEITYDWADDDPAPPGTPLTQTVLDLGLWDDDGYRTPAGFRGWSGSRLGRVSSSQPPVFVQQDTAARGYVPGAIGPGTWHVEIGVGSVTPSPAGASWTATVTCSSPEVEHGLGERRPGRRWVVVGPVVGDLDPRGAGRHVDGLEQVAGGVAAGIGLGDVALEGHRGPARRAGGRPGGPGHGQRHGARAGRHQHQETDRTGDGADVAEPTGSPPVACGAGQQG